MNRVRNLLRSAGLDQAIVYSVASRIWQFLAGGLSLVIIAKSLSPESQGYYYTFASLLAIQTFFDLGLTGVLVNVSSHEWDAAENPSHEGNAVARGRLSELVSRSQRWYRLCAFLFVLIAGVVGYLFFSTSGETDVNWKLPCFAAVILSGMSIHLAPSIAILEGCNRMATVNAYRFGQAVAGNLGVWAVLLMGGGLLAIPCSIAIRVGFELWLVHRRFGEFFAKLSETEDHSASFSWRTELLPLQWRIAIQSIASYFAIGLYTPIIFKYHGPVAGGKMGMTWNAISTIQMAAFAWIYTRVPEIGRLLSERRVAESRRVFRRMLAVSTGIYLLGVGLFLLLLQLCSMWAPSIAARMLSMQEAALLCLGMLLSHVAVGLGAYVRAMKIDPFLLVGVCTSSLMGCLVWFLGMRMGPTGVAFAHIGVIGAISLPAHIWFYRRSRGER